MQGMVNGRLTASIRGTKLSSAATGDKGLLLGRDCCRSFGGTAGALKELWPVLLSKWFLELTVRPNLAPSWALKPQLPTHCAMDPCQFFSTLSLSIPPSRSVFSARAERQPTSSSPGLERWVACIPLQRVKWRDGDGFS
jgi:hypothetical protein